MVMIVLKWLLAMLLTSVPFVFHYCIKPKAASSDKWRNLYSFLSARMPWLKRKALAVKAWGWSRPAVLAFVDQLQKYEILEVCNMVTSKVVHLKPSIFSSGLSPTPGG